MLREHAMYTHHCFVLACCLGAALPPRQRPLRPRRTERPGLSQLRGRYVLPGRIVSFGVTMRQHLAERQRRVLGARVDLQVRQNLARPVLNVTLVDRPGDAHHPSPATAGSSAAPDWRRPRGQPEHPHRRRPQQRQQWRQHRGPPRRGAAATAGRHAAGRCARPQRRGRDSEGHAERRRPATGDQASGQGASLQSLGAGGLVQSVALSGNRNLVQEPGGARGDAQGPAGRRSGTELRLGAIARAAPSGY